MNSAQNSIRTLLEELVARIDADKTLVNGAAERALIARVAAHLPEVSANSILLRPLMAEEERSFDVGRIISSEAEPSALPPTDAFELLRSPDGATFSAFTDSLETFQQEGRLCKALKRAVLLEKILLPTAATRLVNVLLQRGGTYSDLGNTLNIEAIARAWDGQIFRLSPSTDGRLLPSQTGAPSELALYSLERKHVVFSALASELRRLFAILYGLGGDSEVSSVTIGARFLIPDAGGTPEHVDAMTVATKSSEGLLVNQQFSIFLAAREGEKFMVKNPDGSEQCQSENLSMLAFSPTQNHRHPLGHGSWILVVELLLLVK